MNPPPPTLRLLLVIRVQPVAATAACELVPQPPIITITTIPFLSDHHLINNPPLRGRPALLSALHWVLRDLQDVRHLRRRPRGRGPHRFNRFPTPIMLAAMVVPPAALEVERQRE